MTLQQFGSRETGNVVEAPRIGVLCALKSLACVVLLCICVLWITPFAQAADATGTLTDNITDPQNLLGSNVSAVSDKVKQTKTDTGVTVRLLYVDTFGEDVKPVEFVTQVLESVNPKPNTVLLAVASGDGSLVVASSSNSDEWLRKKATIDALSKAAYDKLATSGEQDWSGAAIAMMDEIVTEKKTSTSTTTAILGVIGMSVALVALIAVVAITVVPRRRKKRKARKVHAKRNRRPRAAANKSPEVVEPQNVDIHPSEVPEPLVWPGASSDYALQLDETFKQLQQSVDSLENFTSHLQVNQHESGDQHHDQRHDQYREQNVIHSDSQQNAQSVFRKRTGD